MTNDLELELLNSTYALDYGFALDENSSLLITELITDDQALQVEFFFDSRYLKYSIWICYEVELFYHKNSDTIRDEHIYLGSGGHGNIVEIFNSSTIQNTFDSEIGFNRIIGKEELK